MQFNNDDVTGLGDKLANLDLTTGERAALHHLIDTAASAGDEVMGFAAIMDFDWLRQKTAVPGRPATRPFIADAGGETA